MVEMGDVGKICRVANPTWRRGTLLSKPASGRAAANASATCDSTVVRRAVPQFASIGVASTVRDRSGVERFDRRTARASPRLSRLADFFASADETRSQRCFAGWTRNIPLFRTALGSTFRPRSAEGASDSSRRRPDRRRADFSSQASLLENVAKRWKTRQGRLQFALSRRLATEDKKADGWTSTRRPAKPFSSASRFETRS